MIEVGPGRTIKLTHHPAPLPFAVICPGGVTLVALLGVLAIAGVSGPCEKYLFPR
jgi:hypothetical protein